MKNRNEILKAKNYHKIAFSYVLKSLIICKCLFLYTSYYKQLMNWRKQTNQISFVRSTNMKPVKN